MLLQQLPWMPLMLHSIQTPIRSGDGVEFTGTASGVIQQPGLLEKL